MLTLLSSNLNSFFLNFDYRIKTLKITYWNDYIFVQISLLFKPNESLNWNYGQSLLPRRITSENTKPLRYEDMQEQSIFNLMLLTRILLNECFLSKAKQVTETIRSNISCFRKKMLDPSDAKSDDLVQMLSPELRTKAQDFFTENEIIYLFIRVFFGKNNSSNFVTLYEFYIDRILTMDFPEAHFVNSYVQFRGLIDLENMQNHEHFYHNWVKERIEPSLLKLFDLSNFDRAEDQQIAMLFKQCYIENMNGYCGPKKDAHILAFDLTCQSIKNHLSHSLGEAINYLENNTIDDFKNELCRLEFKQHLIEIMNAMDQKEPTASEWLEKQFNEIENGPAKEILYQALE